MGIELVENPTGDFTVSVRPKGKRRIYRALLSDVALYVAAKDTKATLAAQGLTVPRAGRRGR